MNPIKLLNDKTSIALNSQMALGLALPPILPLKEIGTKILGSNMFQAKVRLRLDKDPDNEKGWFTIPFDPVISVNGRNVITRRYVAKSKSKGSIKELWSQDDYNISISGVLYADAKEKLHGSIAELRKYCEEKKNLHIECEILNEGFGIMRIAVESYDFPFTKGLEYQSFSIKAYSDDVYQLVEEKKEK